MRRSTVSVWVIGLCALAAPLAAAADQLCRVETGFYDTLRLTNLTSGEPPSEAVVGRRPVRVALSPDGQRAYVSASAGVLVVDLSSLSVVDTLTDSAQVIALAVGPDGVLHVVGRTGDALSVQSYDPDTLAPHAAVPLPFGTYDIRQLAVADRGRWLFVQAYDGEQVIYAIDLARRTIAAAQTPPLVWHKSALLVASPTAPVAYVLQAEERGAFDGALWAIPASGAPHRLAVPIVTGGGLTLSPDGRRLYVAWQAVVDGDRPTLVIDTAREQVVGELPSGTIVGFEKAGCVLISGARVVRRACPGDESSTQVDVTSLTPRRVTANVRDGVVPTVWTDGSCAAPPLLCPDDGACLEISGGSGKPGETVSVSVRLHRYGRTVTALQADLFTANAVPFGLAGPDGRRVQCTVNPAIDKPQSAWACLEPGASGCVSVRSTVISFLDADPIDDGAELFTCAVPIPADTPPGAYRLSCATAGASDPDGFPIPLGCDEATIEVQPADVGSSPQVGSGGAGGCQVAARASGGGIALLLAVPLLALLRRRRVL
ncbi:MAG: hypothetical protein SF182_04585 [Deltaproteobacteria bacterium]|nr:hypothetical protein [Deltaproteobacteria bacterium]